jgi:hypothetical protein
MQSLSFATRSHVAGAPQGFVELVAAAWVEKDKGGSLHLSWRRCLEKSCRAAMKSFLRLISASLLYVRLYLSNGGLLLFKASLETNNLILRSPRASLRVVWM